MSDISFGIRIVDEDGNGVDGAKVLVTYPWTNQEDYTDKDGWVQFERERTMHGGVSADIYVNGEQVAEKIWIDEGGYVTFSYTI